MTDFPTFKLYFKFEPNPSNGFEVNPVIVKRQKEGRTIEKKRRKKNGEKKPQKKKTCVKQYVAKKNFAT